MEHKVSEIRGSPDGMKALSGWDLFQWPLILGPLLEAGTGVGLLFRDDLKDDNINC